MRKSLMSCGFGTSATAIALVFVATETTASTLPPTTAIDNYLIIGNRAKDGDVAVNVQNTELGADRQVLSDGSTVPNSQGEASPNTRSVFYQDGDRWRTDSNPTTGVDAVQAADIFEGIDYSGEVAITSSSGKFSMSNVDVYADIGVSCETTPCNNSVSNSTHFDLGETIGSGGSPMPANGVVDFDATTLLGELDAWHTYVSGLTAEFTIGSSIENENRKDGSGPEVTNLTSIDTSGNSDGVAVIDINVGDNDFNLNNSDWILDGDGITTGIFRIRGNTNFLMSNSSILMSSAYDLAGGIAKALFVHYEEPTDNTDQVFNGDNVVLNGIGLWDLNAFSGGVVDQRQTELVINNGQGCAQFISSYVNFNDVRWNRCSVQETVTAPIPVPAALPLGLSAFGLLAWIGRRRVKTS